MKKIKTIVFYILLTIMGLPTLSTNVLAYANYGINYSGGGALENYVQEYPLVGSDNKLLLYAGSNITHSGMGGWSDGYISAGDRCRKVKYVTVDANVNNGEVTPESLGILDFGYTSTNLDTVDEDRQGYKAEIQFKKISLAKDDNEKYTVAVTYDSNSLWAGSTIYSNSSCTTVAVGKSPRTNQQRIFVEANITLYKNNQVVALKDDDLSFVLVDVDAGQSFKVLNSGNELSQNNMFVANKSALQIPGSQYKNMFNPSGNFIYSQYGTQGGQSIDIGDEGGDVYVKLKKQTQSEGIDIVFGYGISAASAIRFYGHLYSVNYDSDNYGHITGDTEQRIISGNNPKGSTQEPNNDYHFTNWTVNKNVTLTNGSTITAGSTITEDQIRQVVVEDDGIVFTAHHEPNIVQYTVNYTAEEGGSITGKSNETVNSGNHPTGSTQSPDEHHNFTSWTVDKAVTLTNGDTIPAGSTITEDQITQVVVTDNLTFTAHYEMKQYTVRYASDTCGKVTGITTETVNSGDNPTGTTLQTNTGCTFLYWTADTDLTLKDGTTIKAGDPISEEQLKQAIVSSDIVFTAIHSVNPLTVPDTGATSEEGINAVQLTTFSLLGVVACGLVIGYLPFFIKNKKNN